MVKESKKQEPSLGERWKYFIEHYGMPEDQPYAIQLGSMPARQAISFMVDYNDVVRMEQHATDEEQRVAGKLIANSIIEDPENSRKHCLEVVREILAAKDKEYYNYISKELKVGFKNTPIRLEIGAINHKHISKIANVSGIITDAQEPLNYYRKMVWHCAEGHTTERVAEGLHIQKPRKCDFDDCKEVVLQEDPVQCISDTFQILSIQKRSFMDTTVSIPRELQLILIGRDVVDTVNPGDYCIADGVIKVHQVQKEQMNALGTYAMYVYNIIVEKEDMVEVDPEFDRKVEQAVRPDHEDEDFERLVKSIAPAQKVEGIGELVKVNLLLMLAGSDPRWLEGRKRHRGEIQTLLVGDAATGKTSYGEFMMQVFNRAVWASGVKGATSAVGLRASVQYDTTLNTSRLLAGAYPMASTKYGGCVIIDEVADMPSEDYRSILEATDDRQKITVRKHKMSKEIQVNCASLHMCNPKTKNRRWDESKNLHENTGLDIPMLTRYDSIWVFRDVENPVLDGIIADHLINSVAHGKTDEEYARDRGVYSNAADVYPPNFMLAWSQYVRKTFHPRIDPNGKAARKIKAFYENMRKTMYAYNAQQDETEKKIAKITPRGIGDLVRFSEASARAHHRNEVLERDADLAIAITEASMISSGFDPHTMTFSDKSSQTAVEDRTKKYDSIRVEKINRENSLNDNLARKDIIMYDLISDLAQQPCGECGGRGTTVERNIDDTRSQRMECPSCDGRKTVTTMFKLEDLKHMMEPYFQHAVNSILLKYFDKSHPIFADLGNGFVQVGNWEILEKWRYSNELREKAIARRKKL